MTTTTDPRFDAMCYFPRDNQRDHKDDDTNVIRWQDGRLYINGFRGGLAITSRETLARDVLNVVMDRVPAGLPRAFADEVFAALPDDGLCCAASDMSPKHAIGCDGHGWPLDFVMRSDAVEAWLRRREGGR